MTSTPKPTEYEMVLDIHAGNIIPIDTTKKTNRGLKWLIIDKKT